MSVAIFGFGCVAQGAWKVLKNTDFAGEIYVWRRQEKECKFLTEDEARSVNFVKVEHWMDLVNRDDVKVVAELMGGQKGLAFELVEAALLKGKKVVTANKAMLAYHMDHFAEIVERTSGAALFFEGSVCGGMPVLSILNRFQNETGDHVQKIEGILNGSTNYLLTRLALEILHTKCAISSENAPRANSVEKKEIPVASVESVVKEMTSMGYLEADPSQDLGGHDAKHKLVILARLAFKLKVSDPDADVLVQGLQDLTLQDITYAESQRCELRLIGRAEAFGGRRVSMSVMPSLVPAYSLFGQTRQATNALTISSDFMGDLSLSAPGAGSLPTGQAVASDILHCLSSSNHSRTIPSVDEKVMCTRPAFRCVARVNGDVELGKIADFLDLDEEVKVVDHCHYYQVRKKADLQELAKHPDVFLICTRM